MACNWACNWACVIALLKLTSQLFTTSPQPLHNFCYTSPQSLLHLTTIFAAPHYKPTAPHHNLCWTSPQSLLHLTTIFAAPHHDLCCTSPQIRPHHRSALTTDLPSPQIRPHHRSALTTDPPSPRSLLHLTTNFTVPTNSNLALHLHCKSWYSNL